LGLRDEGVEPGQQPAVSIGLVDPAAGLGVAGQGVGVEALRGQDGQVAGVGAEVVWAIKLFPRGGDHVIPPVLALWADVTSRS
jgi:hypothetical protein